MSEDRLEDRLADLIHEATVRAYERVTVESGREATGTDVSLLLIQTQVALLQSIILDDNELIEFWEDVVGTIKNGKDNGTA